MKKNKTRTRITPFFLIIFFGFLGAYILFKLISGFKSGGLLITADRVNIVFYGSQSQLVSFGKRDKVNYVASFSNDHRVIVPGGYGRYRIGSLGGLANLPEVKSDNDLIHRTFSSVISAYVDVVVYPKDASIYDNNTVRTKSFSRLQRAISMFDRSYISDAGFFDRFYVAWLLLSTNESDFVELSTNTTIEQKGQEIFSEDGYIRKYRGFFYHKRYRDESQEVKILYSNYSSAVHLSRIIEGQGISVVDLDSVDKSTKKCVMYVDPKVYKSGKNTMFFLQNSFNCVVEAGKAKGANIVLIPGIELEKKWE